MADNRKEYIVLIAGVRHTMMLDEHDARRFGEAAKLVKGGVAPANKQGGAQNKAAG